MRALIVAVILLAASPSWVDAQCVGSACFSGSGFGGFRSRTVIRQNFRPMRFRQRAVMSMPMGFAGYEAVQFQAAPLIPVVEYAPPPVSYAPPVTYATPQAPTKAPPVPMKAPPLPSKTEPVPSAQIRPGEPWARCSWRSSSSSRTRPRCRSRGH